MTGERECATGMPITPAKPNPSACGMRASTQPAPFGARPFYLVNCTKPLEGMAIARNLNLEMAVRMETGVDQLRGRLLLPLSGGI
jgi:hypothetical protein